MKRFFLLFILFNSIILHAQNFSSLNNDLTESLNVFSIAVSGTNMFIGTNDGVYFSQNNSSNWVAANTDIEGSDVYSIAISGFNIYAATYYGLFSSSNKGVSWNDLTVNLPDAISAYDVIVNGSIILAACDYGIYRSPDNGKSWTKVTTFANTSVQCLMMKKSGVTTYIFAGTYDMGIYRSSNLGVSWSSVNDGQVLAVDECITSIFAKDDGTIFAGDTYGFLYKSSNNGTNWIKLDANYDVSGYVNKFAYNNTTKELFVGVDYYNLYKSSDEGTTWTSCSDTVLTKDMSAKSLFILNENIYVGTVDYGIYKSKLPIKISSNPIISLSGDINFGNVEIGKSKDILIEISNIGKSDLKIDSISYSSGFSGEWSGIISPNQMRQITVTFSPTEVKSYSGNLLVYSNSGSGKNTIKISGMGYKSAAIISLSGSLTFGNVEIGKSSTTNLSILNQGNADLKIDSISFPAGFSGNWSGIISPNQTRQVSVKFSPTEVKSYSGNIFVYSNAASGTGTRPISGIGYKTEAIISLSGSLNFGEVALGKNSTGNLSILNEGNIILKIDSIAFPSGFSGNWTGNINSKQTQIITITFSPTESKSYSGNLIVYSNATSGTNTIAVTGSGVISSVSDSYINNTISLFPNPVSDIMTISFEDRHHLEGEVYLSIFNSLGIEMKLKPSENRQVSQGSSISISTEEFPSGVYNCILNYRSNKIIKSFVVVK
jgi:photosystem II stability/assembly factor-like uncharacterized protein